LAYPLAHSPGLRYLRSMYIRRTHTNNSATGERYFTYRLVKSERVGGCTRQSTLLNLGRHFAIEQDYWPTLCARVDEIMGCQLTLRYRDIARAGVENGKLSRGHEKRNDRAKCTGSACLRHSKRRRRFAGTAPAP
jgi:hypothetical protein